MTPFDSQPSNVNDRVAASDFHIDCMLQESRAKRSGYAAPSLKDEALRMFWFLEGLNITGLYIDVRLPELP